MKVDDEHLAGKKVIRRGTPFTVYFDVQQAEALNSLAKDRHVSKATIIRMAVDQLLRQLESGQMSLNLGIRTEESSGNE